jgi:serine/threonine-protein kinase
MRYCPTCGVRFSEEVGFCPTDGSPTNVMEDVGPVVDPLLGRVIDGRYRVEAQIGEGGMGVVYLASHTVLGKKLALKVLRGEMAKDEDTVKRFMQEAQAATAIGQQNIVDISDFGQLPDGTTYFVMEHLAGQALTKLIKQGGSIPMVDAIRIVRQIASALGAAHQVGVVHRDLKPDNIMLINRGGNPYFVKVLDFGIAKVGGAASKLTKTGMVFGTPHYMAPEQAAGQAVDQRTDVYALGVIMYEMFTGKVPFDADTFMAILSKHMFEAPIPPSQQFADVKLGAIEDVILKALAKKPEDRYQRMEELVEHLDTLASGGTIEIGGMSSGVTPPGGLADALEPPSRTEMRISGVEGSDIPGRSTAPLIAGFIFLLLLGGGAAAAAFFVFAGGSSDPPPLVALPTDTAPAIADSGPSVDAASQVVNDGEEEVARVEIRSEPASATVLIDGVLVGNTPLHLRRPIDDATLAIVVRRTGYVNQEVMVTSTSPDAIDVTLEEEQEEEEEEDRNRPTMRRSMTTTAATSMEDTPAHMESMMSTSFSETVDPWANE